MQSVETHMTILAKALVNRFYDDVWNRLDDETAHSILHPDFAFRGSLGTDYQGPSGFLDYRRRITAALSGFTCQVDDLVSARTRAAARVTFRGTHHGTLFGVSATGRVIEWTGAAFFTSDGRQLLKLWILGDVDDVKRQLGADPDARF
jgi:predicted ester cyclase